jgi:hypothetical protein
MTLKEALYATPIISPELGILICAKSFIDFGKQKRNCASSGEELRPNPSQCGSGISGKI